MCSEGATAQEGFAQSRGFLRTLIISKMKLKQPCLFDVFTDKQICQGDKMRWCVRDRLYCFFAQSTVLGVIPFYSQEANIL